MSRTTEYRYSCGLAAYFLGGLALLAGKPAEARARYEESIAMFTAVEDQIQIDHPREMLGRVALLEGDYDGAALRFQQSLARVLDLNRLSCLGHVLEAFARLAFQRRQPERAARILGAIAAIDGVPGRAMMPVARAMYMQTVAEVKVALDAAGFERCWQEGQAMTVEQVLAEITDDPKSERDQPGGERK